MLTMMGRRPERSFQKNSVWFPSEIRATPRLTTQTKPYTSYRSLLRALIGVYKCASALRLATIPSNKVARNSGPDVFLGGNRGESGATWRDRDDKDDREKNPDHP
jgi:hypothetical protein